MGLINMCSPFQTPRLKRRLVECTGPMFLSFLKSQPESENGVLSLPEEEESEDTSTPEMFDLDDITFLRSLDFKEWKNQDHYAVLGLKELRYKATEENIKRAYRLKVLRHHPDKRKSQGEEVRPDDDYFTCITKAWEILGNPRNRRSYDSVDPMIDDSIPPTNEHSRKNFYSVFGKAFELNSRWSEKKPVLKLGDESTPRKEVEQFYSFWYNFSSWREYSYLDEQQKEKGQVREERKWIERQNKAARVKRKKEEMTRIRSLVDAAYNLDPRILKFKKEDKERKEALKQAKKAAARAQQEEEEQRAKAYEEAMRKQKEDAEAEERARQEALKVEREAQKRALKKVRTVLRKLVKENNYYIKSNAEKVHHMACLEKICECLSMNELEELVSNLIKEGRPVFMKAVEVIELSIEKERQEMMECVSRSSNTTQNRGNKGSAPWTQEQIQLLIKAMNIFPTGTSQRWEVVANFINQHSTDDLMKTPKEVLAKAKSFQSSDYCNNVLKAAANQMTCDNFKKEHSTNLDVTISEKSDSPTEKPETKSTPWTAAEQQLLEQALKSYPTSTPERWDKISKCLPTRSKKDCLRRYKELVEMVKAKKAVQAAASTKIN